MASWLAGFICYGRQPSWSNARIVGRELAIRTLIVQDDSPISRLLPTESLAVFTCRPNSHPFQERHVYLDEPVKIGRSVARCRPAQNNATFDCKVLSRNHALVWFDHKTGKLSLSEVKLDAAWLLMIECMPCFNLLLWTDCCENSCCYECLKDLWRKLNVYFEQQQPA
ncbi:hypothetical protein GOODEAATRI_014786, partial [Goodea atripinnis]